jgi:hypothetical protein
MELKASTIDFRLTMELTPREAQMLEYLTSVGAKSIKEFVGDKFTLKEWESLVPALHTSFERFLQRINDTKDVWSGLKIAAVREK